MSCTSSPTATEYATITTYSLATLSSAVTSVQPFQTVVAQESCVASGTIGSSVGCISTVTQFNTITGTSTIQVGQGAITSIPVVVSSPTKTLYGTDCSGGATQSAAQPTSSTSTSSSVVVVTPVTTSVLVESTLPPTTVVTSSSATLENGSVIPTVVTLVSTLPATQVYQATTVASASPSAISASSGGSGTNLAAIIGGTVGGIVGLLAIVAGIWLCRRRRSWDDIFEKEQFHEEMDHPPPIPVRPLRDYGMFDMNAASYGPVAHGSPPGSPRPSVSLHHPSDLHSRNVSLSAVPLMSPASGSRPSTRGTAISHYSSGSMAPLVATRPSVSRLSQVVSADVPPESSNRTGSPVPIESERLILQVINKSDPPAPAPSHEVIVHTDAGRVEGLSNDPPAYSFD